MKLLLLTTETRQSLKELAVHGGTAMGGGRINSRRLPRQGCERGGGRDFRTLENI